MHTVFSILRSFPFSCCVRLQQETKDCRTLTDLHRPLECFLQIPENSALLGQRTLVAEGAFYEQTNAVKSVDRTQVVQLGLADSDLLIVARYRRSLLELEMGDTLDSCLEITHLYPIVISRVPNVSLRMDLYHKVIMATLSNGVSTSYHFVDQMQPYNLWERWVLGLSRIWHTHQARAGVQQRNYHTNVYNALNSASGEVSVRGEQRADSNDSRRSAGTLPAHERLFVFEDDTEQEESTPSSVMHGGPKTELEERTSKAEELWKSMHIQRAAAASSQGDTDYMIDNREVPKLFEPSYAYLAHRPGPIKLADLRTASQTSAKSDRSSDGSISLISIPRRSASTTAAAVAPSVWTKSPAPSRTSQTSSEFESIVTRRTSSLQEVKTGPSTVAQTNSNSVQPPSNQLNGNSTKKYVIVENDLIDTPASDTPPSCTSSLDILRLPSITHAENQHTMMAQRRSLDERHRRHPHELLQRGLIANTYARAEAHFLEPDIYDIRSGDSPPSSDSSLTSAVHPHTMTGSPIAYATKKIQSQSILNRL